MQNKLFDGIPDLTEINCSFRGGKSKKEAPKSV